MHNFKEIYLRIQMTKLVTPLLPAAARMSIFQTNFTLQCESRIFTQLLAGTIFPTGCFSATPHSCFSLRFLNWTENEQSMYEFVLQWRNVMISSKRCLNSNSPWSSARTRPISARTPAC
ncbi:Hypothetical_protein [Hexamita inflata]|uniref:Hypothetical_protein n=1 Tax=Hexamita inflata TaxID=28002 RepID=A0AA86V581_9EUKA|nr:Hypothetical protein HINF_LOCUS44838 [Hexamita inflata]